MVSHFCDADRVTTVKFGCTVRTHPIQLLQKASSMTAIEPPTTTSYPPYLTVPQVQELTQLSRGQVYRLIERYTETNGAEGIPSVRFGRCLRVPSHMLPHGGDPATAQEKGR